MKHCTIVLLALLSASSFAQTIGSNEHSKYWYYRQQLLSEFVVTGEENPITCDQPSGLSIPANLININEGGERANMGESPLVMGWYIAVLATEYKLLRQYGQPTERTLQELYYALKVYERLDRKCERLFWPYDRNTGCPTGNYNGLMCRGDALEGFGALANPAFKARFTWGGKVHYGSSLSEQRASPDEKINAYLSPDQVSGILLGCAMAKACVPPEVTFRGVSIHNYAKSIAEKEIA